ncbi:MAG TPA: tetratricopeptide repeat protein [Spirochaetota bacterium]|nr:tetratricopeptide repeat protein [Spirochaetota bacterium]HOS32118.1 tetratricopeptide repeat protein [Spirochaetota bacterium]HOS55459.1 tetratricopeptide repeat protein [Spirochaetota bacterium]HPK62230.1 tetratricopeptide repeat protein [Spirochaetota bacterium]HQF77981.1 tetratricopeptide repeat protein [Spirochaetota bacterium]
MRFLKNIGALLVCLSLVACGATGPAVKESIRPNVDLDIFHSKKITKNTIISVDDEDYYLPVPKSSPVSYQKKRDNINIYRIDDYIVDVSPKKTNKIETQVDAINKTDIFSSASANETVDKNILNKKVRDNPIITDSTIKELTEEKTPFSAEIDSNFPNDFSGLDSDKNILRYAIEIEDKNYDLSNNEKIRDVKIIENKIIEIAGEENGELSISLKGSNWILRKIEPDYIKLTERTNTENNTAFIFNILSVGKVDALFTRFDAKNNYIERQSYVIVIKPKESVVKNANSKENNNTTKTNTSTDKNLTNENNKKIALDLFNSKKYGESKDIYEKILKNGGGDGEIYYNLGKINYALGDKEKAVDNFTLNLGIKDNPFYKKSFLELINTYKETKRYREAVDAFNKHKKDEFSGDKDVAIILADLYYLIESYGPAIAEYRKILNMFPETNIEDKALFYLANSLEKDKINPDYKESYRLYKILVNKFPESKYYQISKNRLLFLERHYLKVN